MDPRKTNARRGFRQREAIRRQNASEWQKEDFFPKEEKMNASANEPRKGVGPGVKLLITLLVMVILSICILVFVWNPFGIQITRSLTTPPPAVVEPTAFVDTQATQIALLESKIAELEKEPTAVPVIPTAPAVLEPTAIPMPIAVVCDTPSIKAGLNSADTEYGEFLDTTLGKRMTFTSRKVVVPSKAWNETLTADELLSVETTWLTMQVCVPEGMWGTVFTGGLEQGLNRYETGAFLSLEPGLYNFRLRNGEIVLWYPQQETFANQDLTRIIEQIKNGNFDIKGPLAFFAVTSDLMPKIPSDLVKERNVQIAAFLEPAVK